MKKGLIIFDLDGTLTESGPGVMNCVAYACEKMGYEIPGQDVLESFVGPPLKTHLMTVFGMNDEQAEEGVRLFRERYESIGIFENSLYDGIIELLENLKSDGYTISIATSKPEPLAKRVTKDFGLDKFLGFWKGASCDSSRDDKADIIEKVIDECGFADDREKVIMVGDRKYDAMGAKICGIGFMGAGWGYAPEGELEKYSPMAIASSPKELYKEISKSCNY